MPHRLRPLARALRYYLLHYRILNMPLGLLLFAVLFVWLVNWCTAGRLTH